MKLIEQEYTLLPVQMLVPHELNPNIGDEEALADSIDANGFYGAVTVREHPDLAGKYQILAGEHRWKHASKHGEGQIPAIILDDVDDVRALRILLADNEITRRGSTDNEVLDKALAEIGDLKGSGYDDALGSLAEKLDREAAERAEEYSDESGSDSEFVSQYGVLVTAEDEVEQKELYDVIVAKFGIERVRVVSV